MQVTDAYPTGHFMNFSLHKKWVQMTHRGVLANTKHITSTRLMTLLIGLCRMFQLIMLFTCYRLMIGKIYRPKKHVIHYPIYKNKLLFIYFNNMGSLTFCKLQSLILSTFLQFEIQHYLWQFLFLPRDFLLLAIAFNFHVLVF